MTFTQDSCKKHSVEINVPNQRIPVYKECGKLGLSGGNEDLKISSRDMKLGVVQVYVKMKQLTEESFTINWKY